MLTALVKILLTSKYIKIILTKFFIMVQIALNTKSNSWNEGCNLRKLAMLDALANNALESIA